MTTPHGPTVNQALLALYGALDRAVTGNQGSGVEEIVERYLPGSTGGNAGWYDALLGFLQSPRDTVRDAQPAPHDPDVGAALTALQNTRGGSDEELPSDSLSTVQLSRMVYAIGALSHLPAYQGVDEWDVQFSRTLTLVQPAATPMTSPVSGAPDGDLLGLLHREFRRRDDWPAVMRLAADNNLIDDDVAEVPLCEFKATWVHGHLCAALTTEFTSNKASLDDVKNVIDPLNWPKCLSFFCAMDAEPTRTDGWSRVLEHVSTTCSIAGTPQMVTPLKYWKGPPADESVLTAYVNYALDDQPAAGEQGDGRVVVDQGFIRMMALGVVPAAPGVRVRTRKVVGFRDLPWIAGAIFACSMGYGYEGMDMVLDGVKQRQNHNAGWTDWTPSTAPQNGPPVDPKKPHPSSDPSRRAVTIAIDMANECIDDMSTKSAAIAAKWAAGQLPIEETIAYSTELAVRLAVDPWRYLERLRDPTQGNHP